MKRNLIGYFAGLPDCTQYSVKIISDDSISKFDEIYMAGDRPFVVSYDVSSTPFEPVRYSRASINVVASEYFFDVFGEEAQSTKVILTNEDTQTIEWVGYLTSNLLNMPQDSCDYETFSLEAEDCLSTLEHYDYQGWTSAKTIVNFTQLLAGIANRCGQITDLYVDMSLLRGDGTYITMSDLTISEQNFFSSDTDEPWTVQEVLVELCKYLGYTAMQIGTSLYLVDFQAHTGQKWSGDTETLYYNFYHYAKSTNWDTFVQEAVNVDGITLKQSIIRGTGSDISLETLYNKIQVKDSFYEIDHFIPDPYEDNYLTNREGDFWKSNQIAPGGYHLNYMGKNGQVKSEEKAENEHVYYIRKFDHNNYDYIYRDVDTLQEVEVSGFTLSGISVSNVEANTGSSGSTGQFYDLHATFYNNDEVAHNLSVYVGVGCAWYQPPFTTLRSDEGEKTYTFTIQPHSEYVGTFSAACNSGDIIIALEYRNHMSIDGGEDIEIQGGYSSLEMKYISSCIVDLAVFDKPMDTSKYLYETESDISFDRYIMVHQHDKPYRMHPHSQWLFEDMMTPLHDYEIEAVFPEIMRLSSGYTNPMIVDNKAYLALNAQAIYERYEVEYINPDWTNENTRRSFLGLFGPVHGITTIAPCLIFKLKIGDKYWSSELNQWTTTEGCFVVNLGVDKADKDDVDFTAWWNKEHPALNNISWTDWAGLSGYKIPLDETLDFSQPIEFSMMMPSKMQKIDGDNTIAYNEMCWVKDLGIEFTTKDCENYDNADVLYENILNSGSVNTLSDVTCKITTYPGEGMHSYSSVGLDGVLVNQIVRIGLDDVPNKAEENIIKAYSNQYSSPTIKQTMTIDLDANQLSRIYDPTITRFFSILGGEINYAMGSQRLTLIQSKMWNEVEPEPPTPVVEVYVQDLLDEGWARVVPGPHGNYIEVLSGCPYASSEIVDLWEVALNEKQLSAGTNNVIVWTQPLPDGWGYEIGSHYTGDTLANAGITPHGGQFWAEVFDPGSTVSVKFKGGDWISTDYPWGSYQSQGVFAPRYTADTAKMVYYANNGFFDTPEALNVSIDGAFGSVAQVMFTNMRGTRYFTLSSGTIVSHDSTGIFEGCNNLETATFNSGTMNWGVIRTAHNMFDGDDKLRVINGGGPTIESGTTSYNTFYTLFPRFDGTRGSADCSRVFDCSSLRQINGLVIDMSAISLSGTTYGGYSQAALSDKMFYCPSATSIYIKGLNNNNWDLTDPDGKVYLPSLNKESVYFLLNNITDCSSTPHTLTLSLDCLTDYVSMGGYVVPSSDDPIYPAYQIAQARGWNVMFVGDIPPTPPTPGSLDEYLTFEIVSGGTIKWKSTDGNESRYVKYSKNDGNWVNYTISTAGSDINVSAGDRIRFSGVNQKYYVSLASSTASFNVRGNMTSILDSSRFSGGTEPLRQDGVFDSFFAGTKVIDASQLLLPSSSLTCSCYTGMFKNCVELVAAPALPATGLNKYNVWGTLEGTADYCYHQMFYGCTSLTTPPALPATSLAKFCYDSMFMGCTSLTTAPALPATVKDSNWYCYHQMFRGCTSLTTPPALPSTYLSDSCYALMFAGCTGLTSAPELPATTGFTTLCYEAMFSGCTSLTTAPELPMETLGNKSYDSMFYGCTSLNYIKCLATDISSASHSTQDWVYGVAPTGTFVKSIYMSDWTTGVDGIPSGWTVVDYGEISSWSARNDSTYNITSYLFTGAGYTYAWIDMQSGEIENRNNKTPVTITKVSMAANPKPGTAFLITMEVYNQSSGDKIVCSWNSTSQAWVGTGSIVLNNGDTLIFREYQEPTPTTAYVTYNAAGQLENATGDLEITIVSDGGYSDSTTFQLSGSQESEDGDIDIQLGTGATTTLNITVTLTGWTAADSGTILLRVAYDQTDTDYVTVVEGDTVPISVPYVYNKILYVDLVYNNNRNRSLAASAEEEEIMSASTKTIEIKE